MTPYHLLDRDDAMRVLGWDSKDPKDKRAFYRWLGERWVPVVRLGRSRRLRIREDHLRAYIDRQTEPAYDH